MIASTPTTTISAPMMDHMRCSYQSKHCDNPRAMKQNGELHRLCEFHRKKANLNQMRMQQRRRVMKRQALHNKLQPKVLNVYKAVHPYSHPSKTIDPIKHESIIEPFLLTLEPFKDPCTSFPEDDVKLLTSLLFDANDLSLPAITEQQSTTYLLEL